MMKKLIFITIATILNTPILFAYGHISVGHLVDEMPVVIITTGQQLTSQQRPEFKAVVDEWFASDCFMSKQHSVDVVVDAEGMVTHILRWSTKAAFDRDATIECSEFDKLMSMISKIGGSDMKPIANTSIASSPR
mgnify:FL=1